MKQAGVALALGLVGIVLAVALLGWFDPGQAALRAERTQIALEQARALAPLWLSVKRVLIGSLAVTGAAVAMLALAVGCVALISVPNGVRWTWLRSWLVKPGRYGAQYPTLAAPDGQGHIRILAPVNEAGSQRVAALTTGLGPDVRLTGATVRQVLREDDPQAMLEARDEPVEVEPAQDALTVDPVEKPHWLIVGQTGSGKSTATRYIMTQLAAKYRCEFVICEPGGIDWNSAASAVSQRGIAGAIKAVYGEFEERQTILREADVAHISQLTRGGRLPYLYLVVEELEAVLDDLKVMDKGLASETLINLRQIARMGRKPGVGLIAVTQAARTDVFDSHVRTNLANVLLFRNGQGTAEMFRVGQLVTLPGLATGECYSLAHGHRLTFPLVARPSVPLSGLYREKPLQLAADAEADGRANCVGVADEDLPDGVGGELLQPLQPAQPGRNGFQTAVATVVRIPKRLPTAEEAEQMRRHYARTGSKTAVNFAFYGYKDNDTWAYVEQALRGEL